MPSTNGAFLIVSSLETLEQKHFFLLLLILDCSRHQGKISSIGLRSSRKEDTGGQVRLRPPYEFYRLACEAAKRGGLEVEEYLSNVEQLSREFIQSKHVVDREAFVAAIREAMLSKRFTLVLGGKNLGKTLVQKQTVRDVENEVGEELIIFDIDMREAPDKPLFQAIFDRIVQKKDKFQGLLSKIFKTLLPDLVEVIGKGRRTAAFVEELVSPKQTLMEMILAIQQQNEFGTCLVVDEANLALPGLADTDAVEATRSLQFFVMLTKQQQLASVVLISSELGYPFRLLACGMNLQDIQNIIIANEVPRKEMVELMVNGWNMSADLAEEFFKYYGGNIDLCCRGVELLHARGKDFDPFAVLQCPGLPSCAADPDAKNHLQNLAKQGWSPVYDVEADKAAKLIAEKNVGGVIPEYAKAFDLPEGIWKGNHEYALVPSGTLMRWKIAKELERVDSMGARNLDALLVEQTQLHAVFSHFACFRSQGGSL